MLQSLKSDGTFMTSCEFCNGSTGTGAFFFGDRSFSSLNFERNFVIGWIPFTSGFFLDFRPTFGKATSSPDISFNDVFCFFRFLVTFSLGFFFFLLPVRSKNSSVIAEYAFSTSTDGSTVTHNASNPSSGCSSSNAATSSWGKIASK